MDAQLSPFAFVAGWLIGELKALIQRRREQKRPIGAVLADILGDVDRLAYVQVASDALAQRTGLSASEGSGLRILLEHLLTSFQLDDRRPSWMKDPPLR